MSPRHLVEHGNSPASSWPRDGRHPVGPVSLAGGRVRPPTDRARVIGCPSGFERASDFAERRASRSTAGELFDQRAFRPRALSLHPAGARELTMKKHYRITTRSYQKSANVLHVLRIELPTAVEMPAV